MGWLAMGDIPIQSGVETCPIVLEIFCLGGKQPMKLIVVPLDKVPKSGAL